MDAISWLAWAVVRLAYAALAIGLAHVLLLPLLRSAQPWLAPRLPRPLSDRLAWFLRHPWHRLVLWVFWLVQRAWNLGRAPRVPTPAEIVDDAIRRAGGLEDFSFDDGHDDGQPAAAAAAVAPGAAAARAEHEEYLRALLPALYREWQPYAAGYPLAEKLATRLHIAEFCRRNPGVVGRAQKQPAADAKPAAKSAPKAAASKAAASKAAAAAAAEHEDEGGSSSGGGGPLVRRPLWIVGLPRTGSTLLHKLLSLDCAARSLRAWELKRPLPPPCDLPPQARAARLADLRSGTAVAAAVCPEIAEIHFVDADDPDECVNGYFPDPAPVFLWGAVDMAEAYAAYTRSSMARQFADYRLLVQLLCFERHAAAAAGDGDGRHTHTHVVLKSPHHTFHLPSVAGAFPGSTLVWLHRDPRQVVGSCCSMNLVFREYTHPWFEAPAALGRRTLARLADAARAAARARAQLEAQAARAQQQAAARAAGKGGGGGKNAAAPPCRFVDLYFKDLVRDPVGAVRGLYAAAGLAWRDDIGDAIRAHMGNRAKPSHTAGKHRYKLADFGLTDADVQEAFADYLAVHGDRL